MRRADRLVQALRAQARRGGGEGPDAGQHDGVGARDAGRIRRPLDGEPRALERLRDAAQVAGAVVDERRRGGSGIGIYSAPFTVGSPGGAGRARAPGAARARGP